MSYRKHFTAKDENHNIVKEFMQYGCGGFTIAPKEIRGKTLAYTANYKGYKFIAHDCANFGGVFVDWLVACVDNGNTNWIEVKTPEAYKADNHSLTDGEAWLMYNSGMVQVAVTLEDVQAIFEGMLNE